MLRHMLPVFMAGAMMGDFNALPKKEKEVKKCLVCGSIHSHNNAFCSAECCGKYKMTTKTKTN